MAALPSTECELQQYPVLCALTHPEVGETVAALHVLNPQAHLPVGILLVLQGAQGTCSSSRVGKRDATRDGEKGTCKPDIGACWLRALVISNKMLLSHIPPGAHMRAVAGGTAATPAHRY